MVKIKLLSDLQKIKDEYITEKSSGDSDKSVVQIKVGMATCGIASGAKEIMKYLIEGCEHNAVDFEIKQTGCLGYCYAEPMVEVKLPCKKPKVFGFVDKTKVSEIIEKYIIQGENVEGEIPISFQTINA